MAYINGEYTHEETCLRIEVCEPTKDEYIYEYGMFMNLKVNNSQITLEELESLGNWILERAKFIKNNFTKKGKLKKQKQ